MFRLAEFGGDSHLANAPRDSGVFVAVVIVLVVAALAASLIPAIRARGLEPYLVLRQESFAYRTGWRLLR